MHNLYTADGGLGYYGSESRSDRYFHQLHLDGNRSLANLIAIVFGECINFPLQRNMSFKHHDPWYFRFCAMGWLPSLFLVMNLFTGISNPITVPLITNEALRNTVSNIVTTVVIGGVSMVTLGTGIGGGLVVNEQIVNGVGGGAGEIGHFRIDSDETEVCKCGSRAV